MPSGNNSFDLAAALARFEGRPPWYFKLWCWLVSRGRKFRTTRREMANVVSHRAGAREVGPGLDAITKFMRDVAASGGVEFEQDMFGLEVTMVAERHGFKGRGDDPYHDFGRYFCERWLAAHGTKYPWAGKKDWTALAAIWKAVGQDLDRGKAVVDAFLADTTPFNEGHPLSKLRLNIAAFIARATKRKPATRKRYSDYDPRAGGKAV